VPGSLLRRSVFRRRLRLRKILLRAALPPGHAPLADVPTLT
jgi:hypothetical protein